jgi:hypothetical protein
MAKNRDRIREAIKRSRLAERMQEGEYDPDATFTMVERLTTKIQHLLDRTPKKDKNTLAICIALARVIENQRRNLPTRRHHNGRTADEACAQYPRVARRVLASDLGKGPPRRDEEAERRI